MLDRPLAFLDLETTGATAAHDRITEIGLIEVEDGCVTAEWSSLVNPEARIPPFIEHLTGISNDMVGNAPKFTELAASLKERLAGRLLVAHNARFDYGFLKQEFARLGIDYSADLVCTVKLSRKLYPGHARHNLDTLMERHAVNCSARHRALGDARVLWDLLQIWRDELGAEAVDNAARAQLKMPTLPPGLSGLALDKLPATPGVYLFYGENDLPIYVGKSVNLRARVLSHFANDIRSAKEMSIVQQIRRVDWRETAGELGALLEESRLVKKLLPTLNRHLRRNSDLCAFEWRPGQSTPPQLVNASDIDFSSTTDIYGVFRSRRAAMDTLRNLAQAFELCLIETGLEKGGGPCFGYQIKRCRGVCNGGESREQHALRMMEAFGGIKLKAWPFAGRVGVRESSGDDSDLHILDHWCYLGTVRSPQDLDTLDAHPAFDLDTYKILKRFLAGNRAGLEIVPLDR